MSFLNLPYCSHIHRRHSLVPRRHSHGIGVASFVTGNTVTITWTVRMSQPCFKTSLSITAFRWPTLEGTTTPPGMWMVVCGRVALNPQAPPRKIFFALWRWQRCWVMRPSPSTAGAWSNASPVPSLCRQSQWRYWTSISPIAFLPPLRRRRQSTRSAHRAVGIPSPLPALPIKWHIRDPWFGVTHSGKRSICYSSSNNRRLPFQRWLEMLPIMKSRPTL